VESLSLSTLRLIEEHAMKDNTGQVLVQAPQSVANYMLNEKRASVVEIELRNKVHVVIVADEKLQTPHIEIQRIREADMGEHSKPSYERLTAEEADVVRKMGQMLGSSEQPVVSGIVPSSPAPVREEEETATAPVAPVTRQRQPVAVPAPAPTASQSGFLSKLFGLFRGNGAVAPAPAPAPVAARPQAARGNRQQENRRNEPRTRGEGQQQRQNPQQREARGTAQQQGKSQNQQRQRQEQPGRQQQGKREPQQRQPKPPTQTGEVASAEQRNKQQDVETNKQTQQEHSPRQPQAERQPPQQQQPVNPPAAKPAEVPTPATEVAVTVAAATENNATAGEASAESAGQSRRRRGRRGGRRRRRHEGAADAGQNDQAHALDLDDEDRDDLETSAPEADAAPAEKPAPAATHVTAAPAPDHTPAPAVKVVHATPFAESHAPVTVKEAVAEVESIKVTVGEPQTVTAAAEDSHASAPLIIAPAPVPASFNLPVLPPIPVREATAETEAPVAIEEMVAQPHEDSTIAQDEVVTVSVPHGVEPAANETRVAAESIVIAETKHADEPALIEPITAPAAAEPVVVTPAPLIHQPEQGDLLAAPLHHSVPAEPLHVHNQQVGETKEPSSDEEHLPADHQRDNRLS
jgi:ribonuclease E